jgi:hypothetical protein
MDAGGTAQRLTAKRIVWDLVQIYTQGVGCGIHLVLSTDG